MSAAESLGEKRNSFVFPLTKISRRFICNTGKKQQHRYIRTVYEKHCRTHEMEHDTNNCPTCCIKHSQMGKAQRFTLMSFLIGNRRRIWRPWGASFRRINSHLLIQLPPLLFFHFSESLFLCWFHILSLTGSLSPFYLCPHKPDVLLGSVLLSEHIPHHMILSTRLQ